MLQAFVVVWREVFEAFLMVAMIVAYLRKTRQLFLLPAVRWGIAASGGVSAGLGYLLLLTANESLWEAIFGGVAAVLVSWLVIHLWRTASRLKQEMERSLEKKTVGRPTHRAVWAVFLFTVLMISREGMEAALLLIQIQEPRIVSGILLGLLAAGGMAFLWARLGPLIDLKLFFQGTAVFLLLFIVQILLSSFHEFAELGIFPESEALHEATEPFSSGGLYGKWFSFVMLGGCLAWLLAAWVGKRLQGFPAESSESAG